MAITADEPLDTARRRTTGSIDAPRPASRRANLPGVPTKSNDIPGAFDAGVTRC